MGTITTRDGTQIYEGGGHGIGATQKDRVKADLLAFFGGPR
jgi:hypothetical protein